MNPLLQLQEHRQAVWLDFVERDFIADGGLKRLVEQDGLRGVTSNPSIFDKAIGKGGSYDDSLNAALGVTDIDVTALYERMAIEDIRAAADVLRPVYVQNAGHDGFVSLEVSPYLAMDTEATIAEARRLWIAVQRPNLMVKVPGTQAGLPAIRQLIGEGININITLLFAQEVYEAVAEAYLAGLEQFAARGGDLRGVSSVASFFVSRIDNMIDKAIDRRLQGKNDPDTRARLEGLKGKVAIANAKLAYRRYQRLFSGTRWARLRDQGASVQRLLWASTSTKNPSYRDVLYVEELIGPDTVNTLPPATMDAFRDHGVARETLTQDVGAAEKVMATLAEVGIPMNEVTDALVKDGVKQFADAADALLSTVAAKRAVFLDGKLNGQSRHLPAALEKAVANTLKQLTADGAIRRLWRRDAGLWTGHDEDDWLGWLDIVGRQWLRRGELLALADEARAAGIRHVLLLGMGGSSLGPEVLGKTFGARGDAPELLVLDSTDPQQIRAFEARIDPASTWFVVSSKSGSTLVPNILKDYFFDRAKHAVGADKVGGHFIAVTDPGSALEKQAQAEGFRRIFHGIPSIGGRYSVLSDFGMVPGALTGLDLARFLDATASMVRACGGDVPPAVNPGAELGAVLGVAGKGGRDKVTIVASPGIGDLGAWLEQLLAESTGKQGKGLIPLALEPAVAPATYGADRIFVYLRLDDASDAAQDQAVDALQQAGQPVVRISVTEPHQLGQEFFRWEIATAVAGAILGIDPFDQPDVEASKVRTRDLMDAYEKSGALPEEKPVCAGDGLRLFTDKKNAAALGAAKDPAALLRAHLARIKPGDYCALLAYVERDADHAAALEDIRRAILERKHVATCLGFGPRFLHSTGQAYKGGPNSGVFLQITADDANDLKVPGKSYTFGTVKAAQARGDFEVLADRGRRALRIHLGADVGAGLARLGDMVRAALA